ncbi:hypothetical protein J6590_007474 [Homalodisca vitripennis]|nr:hypothetical protein J6590_007474 [Homalodisca vitripennis]
MCKLRDRVGVTLKKVTPGAVRPRRLPFATPLHRAVSNYATRATTLQFGTYKAPVSFLNRKTCKGFCHIN